MFVYNLLVQETEERVLWVQRQSWRLTVQVRISQTRTTNDLVVGKDRGNAPLNKIFTDEFSMYRMMMYRTTISVRCPPTYSKLVPTINVKNI